MERKKTSGEERKRFFLLSLYQSAQSVEVVEEE